MGSFIEINDTLRITKNQGFPVALDIDKHLEKPYTTEMFAERIFEFNNKNQIRFYQIPPVRNFLVEDIGGKWLYWGLVHILEIHHDYQAKTTSGKFKIVHINTPVEMKAVFDLIDRVKGNNFFT